MPKRPLIAENVVVTRFSFHARYMLQTLFYIPHEFLGLPILGWGGLLWAWLIFSLGYLAYHGRRYGWSGQLASTFGTCVVIAAAIYFVLPRIAEPSGLPIRGYGLMMLLAVFAGVALSIHRARAVGMQDEVIYNLAMWMLPLGIVGARLFYVIEYHEKFFAPELTWTDSLKRVLSMHEGGLVVFGSLIGAVAGLLLFVCRHQLPLFKLLDVVAPGMAIGQAIGRIGCFLNGCCFGGPCDLPWSVTFPQDSPPYVAQVDKELLPALGIRWRAGSDGLVVAEVSPESDGALAGVQVGDTALALRLFTGEETKPIMLPQPGSSERIIDPAAARWLCAQAKPGDRLVILGNSLKREIPIVRKQRSLPIHPAQLYSAIDAALLAWLLCAATPFKRFHGDIIGLTLILHAISRYLLEEIRIDEAGVFGTGLSISQNISIAMLVVGVGLLLGLRRLQPASLRVDQL